MISHVPTPVPPSSKPIAVASKAPKTSTPKLKGTPTQRQRVRHKLQTAKTQARKTPTLEGPLQPDQRRFDEAVAKRTKLNPRTVGAQSLAEESGEAAAQRQAEGNQNWLNIGPGATLAPTPKGAAKETAALINTSSNYAGIRASRGRGAPAQIAAIAASPWGTQGATMAGTLPLVGISPAKQAAKAKVRKLTGKAKALGMKTGSPEVGSGQPVGPPPPKLVKRVVVAEHAMREVEGTPYVWGGGHASFTAAGGLDCSGAVSYVVHKLAPNRLKAPLTSGSMGQVLDPGPGAFTVFYNSTHTFIRYVNRKGKLVYWGTSVGDSGAGGLTSHPAPSASYLAQYNVGHIPGMGREQALQLGASPAELAGGGTIAGMTFSPSGTTATIAQGTTKGKPGFSRLPIKLTPYQKLQRFRLRRKGGEAEPTTATTPGKESALATLERKYGRTA